MTEKVSESNMSLLLKIRFAMANIVCSHLLEGRTTLIRRKKNTIRGKFSRKGKHGDKNDAILGRRNNPVRVGGECGKLDYEPEGRRM